MYVPFPSPIRATYPAHSVFLIWSPECSSHLTFYTLTKSNLYLANYLTNVVSDPDLYRLLTFHRPNLISIFHFSGRTEGSVRFWGFCDCNVVKVLRWEVVAPRPTPKLEDHPLSAVRDCLFSIFISTVFRSPRRAVVWWSDTVITEQWS